MDDQPTFRENAALPESTEDALTPRELALIAKGEASVAAFGTIPADEGHAWIDSLFTSAPLPQPQPRKRL